MFVCVCAAALHLQWYNNNQGGVKKTNDSSNQSLLYTYRVCLCVWHSTQAFDPFRLHTLTARRFQGFLIDPESILFR